MKITAKDVAYVADLANLELTEAERQSMLRDLNSILEYMDRLNQLDTANMHPVATCTEERSNGAAREDILEGLRKSLSREVALQNAPDTDGKFFRVPKVIERQ